MNSSIKQEYTYNNETGDAVLTVYSVFPGIEVTYNSIHMDRFTMQASISNGNYIEIHHCREGRIEQEFGNDFFYLMPGDLSVSKQDAMKQEFIFPLRHYHGISILINIDTAPKCFSAFMEDENIQPTRIVEKLCNTKPCSVLRSEALVEHIFSEMYTIREEDRVGYLKIKILELLYVLNCVDTPSMQSNNLTLTKSQVNLAKSAALYLSENLDKHITIPELAKTFAVSETVLKTAFKGVYGVAIFSYVRIQKMQQAAGLIMNTERPISDIAYEFGYNNESKFSAAFKEIMGDTPAVWRRLHTKINIV